MTTRRSFALAAALALLPPAVSAGTVPKASPPPAAQDAGTLEEGRKLTTALYAGGVSGIWSRLSPALQTLAGSEERLAQLAAGWIEKYGRETKVLEEKTDSLAGARRYLRVAAFEKAKDPVEVPWNFDEKGRIATIGLRPRAKEAAAPNGAKETPASLRLPVDGEWTVWWGGRTVWENFHATAPDRRFAADFFVVRAGTTHAGDGTKNEDYFAFGQNVLAPAAGTVVAVESDRPDALPGVVDPQADADGNFVVLDVGKKVWVFLAHLQKGSLVVKRGQKVKAGDLLAKSGNSGRGTEPSLHVHLQDAAEAGKGNGWPLAFRNVVVNGTPVARAEPVRGQRFSPRPPSAP